MADEEERVVATIREIADAHGISVEGARLKVKRRVAKGLWRTLPQNHPNDPVRVDLPRSEIDVGAVPPPTDTTVGERAPAASDAPQSPPHKSDASTSHDENRWDTNALEALVENVGELTNRVEALTERLLESERCKAQADLGRVEAEKEAALAKADVRHMQERLETAMTMHREELSRREKASADDLSRVQAAGDKEIAELRSVIEELQARPWWRRLVG